MLYSILIFGSEERFAATPPGEVSALMERHAELRRDLVASRSLGPVFRLGPSKARTVRKYKDRHHITDGPFAESKEQLMGIYIVDCATFEDALAAVERLDFEGAAFEITPVTWLDPGVVPARTDEST